MVQIPDVVFGNVRDAVEKYADLGSEFYTGDFITVEGGLRRPDSRYPATRALWDAFFKRKARELGDTAYAAWLAEVCHEIPMGQPNPPVHTERHADPKESNPKAVIGVRKASLSVVPMDVVLEASLGMLEGAAKYGKANYLASGAKASVYFDGTQRHLNQWWLGEDMDPDSGLHHISKAISSLMVLRACMLAKKFTDDRPPRTGFCMQDLNTEAARILDKHADKHPTHYTIQDNLGE